MDTKYLRLKDAAAYLGCSVPHLRNLMRDKLITYSKPSRGMIVFTLEDLDTFVERGRNAVVLQTQLQK